MPLGTKGCWVWLLVCLPGKAQPDEPYADFFVWRRKGEFDLNLNSECLSLQDHPPPSQEVAPREAVSGVGETGLQPEKAL